MGGGGTDYAYGVVIDSFGTIYVTGRFNGTVDFNADGDTSDAGETSVAPYGGDDAFLSAFDASGNNLWYKRWGGAGLDYGFDVAIDSSGMIYVTGLIEGTADLNADGDTNDANETSIAPYGGYDGFLSVFDASGNNLWYKRFGGAGMDYTRRINFSSGNIYISGGTTGTADLNGDGDTNDANETGVAPYGNDDAFLSAFDSSGNGLWSERLGGGGINEVGTGLGIGSSGNIYISGGINGTADLNGDGDTNDANETSIAPYGSYDGFLSVFDASGNNLWYKRFGGAGSDSNNNIAVDSSGNIYVSGYITGTADLNANGDTTNPNETTIAPYGSQDVFISVFDASGNNHWYKRFGGLGTDMGADIFIDSSDNMYLTGYITGTADLNADGDTNDANETSIAPYGGSDVFLSVFDASGNNHWYKRFGGLGTDMGYSITVDFLGNLYLYAGVTGAGDLNADGDTNDASETSVAPYGGFDAFLTKFILDLTSPSLSLTPPSSPSGDSTPTLTGTATDAYSPISSVEFQLNSTSGSWTPCTPDDGTFNSASESFSCTTPELTDGTYTIYTRSTDNAENTTPSGEESSLTFKIDLTYPSLTLNPLPPLTNDSTLILTGTTKDTDGTIQNVEYQLDSLSGSWTPCTSNDSLFEEQEESFTCTLTNLSDGNHIIYIRSTDNVGNSTSIQTSPSEDTTIDTKEPTLEPKSQITLELKGTKKTNIEEGETFYTQKERPELKGRNEEAKNGTVVLYQRTYLGAKRKIATARIDKDGNWEYSLPKKENDSRHYAIKLIDEAGNESDISQWFKVIYDRKAPTFKTELPKTQNVTRGTRIDFPAKDNFSGIDSYQVKLTPYHKEWKKIPNKKDSFFIIPESVSNGIYTLTLKVTDKAGNRLTHSMKVTVGDTK